MIIMGESQDTRLAMISRFLTNSPFFKLVIHIRMVLTKKRGFLSFLENMLSFKTDSLDDL